MLDTPRVNQILSALVRQAGKRSRSVTARVDRLQSMVITMGQHLGVPTHSLVKWRTLVVHAETGLVLDDVTITESGLDPAWLMLEENEQIWFQQVVAVAESWNSAWERGAEVGVEVEHDCGQIVGEAVRQAFEYAQSVIDPLKR